MGSIDAFVDAHAHLPLPADGRAAELLEQWRLSGVVNICVSHGTLGGLAAQRAWYRRLAHRYPGHFAWVTSFPLEGFGRPGWAERVLADLEADLADGAVAVKVWKNVGMELRDPDTGDWVFVDDPRFGPLFSFLESRRVPVLAHIGEPLAAWLPLDPDNPHYSYYSQTPAWHWYGRTDVPSHERLIASRDALLERYPSLRLVGLHLGSHEHDLAEVARRLRRYPNYHVDTGGRLGDLARHARDNRATLVEFLHEFAGRVFWGVDWVLTSPWEDLPSPRQQALAVALRQHYDLERRFLLTSELVQIGPTTTTGLALPETLVRQLCHDAARAFYFTRSGPDATSGTP